MVLNEVWQCGHCGNIYETESEANDCCDGYAEKSYRCSKCNQLYAKGIKECYFC